MLQFTREDIDRILFISNILFLSQSGISPSPGKNFCLHFLNENQLYLDSNTSSPLTFVLRQHCANKTALFALSATDSYQVWLFGNMFILVQKRRSGMTWILGVGSVRGSLQEQWQRPVLPQLVAEIEFKACDHWEKAKTQSHWLHLFDSSPLCIFKCLMIMAREMMV